MRTHDWMVMGLIGLCAVPGLVFTSLLVLRTPSYESNEVVIVEVSDLIEGRKLMRFDSNVATIRPDISVRFMEPRFERRNRFPRLESRIRYDFNKGKYLAHPPVEWWVYPDRR